MSKTPSFLEQAANIGKTASKTIRGSLNTGLSNAAGIIGTAQKTVGTAHSNFTGVLEKGETAIAAAAHDATTAAVGENPSPASASASAEASASAPTDKIVQKSRDHIEKIQNKVNEEKEANKTNRFSKNYKSLVESSGNILAKQHLHHLAAANHAKVVSDKTASQISKSKANLNPGIGTHLHKIEKKAAKAYFTHTIAARLYKKALKTVVGAEHHQRYLDNAQAKLRSQTVQGGKRKHKRKTMKRKSNKRKHKKRHATKKRKHKKRHQTKKRKHKKAHKKKAHKKKHRRTKKQRGGQCPCNSV